MTGSRTSVLFIILFLIISNFFTIFKFFSNNKFFLSLSNFYNLSIIISLILFVSIYILSMNEIFKNRILQSFNLLSSSNAERIYFWKLHLETFLSYDLFSILFGKGSYAVEKIKNGAESTWIMLLNEGGLIVFLFIYYY